MRILFWVPRFWPYIGGVEVFGMKLLPALRERGFEFIVLTSQNHRDLPSEAYFKGIPIHRVSFLEALTNRDLDQLMEVRRRVATLKRTFAPDLVHLQLTPATLLGFFHLHTADAYPAPLLATLHGSLANHPTGQDTLLGRILRSADWITANSAATLDETRQLVPEIIPHSSLIYNGLDIPALPPEPLPTRPPRLLCLGRLDIEKGFDLALAALGLLRDRFPQARVIIAGGGPAQPDLEQQAADMGLADRITFAGCLPSDTVPALMNAATIVVMPSRREGFGLVALEAALMARPVVATRVGGLPEVVVHGQTGLLVEQEDSKALAEAIAFLLALPDAAAQMGQAGRRRAREVFSLERCADAYATLYRKLAKEVAHVDSAEPSAPQ